MRLLCSCRFFCTFAGKQGRLSHNSFWAGIGLCLIFLIFTIMAYGFKYADLLDDDVFKLVFGRESSKDIMIEFLNQVITDRNIVDLEFRDKEMHPLSR